MLCRLKAKLTATLILYLNAYLLHEYRSNIPMQAAIAKFLNFTDEMAVNDIRAVHLSSPSFCNEHNSCSYLYVHFALNVGKIRSKLLFYAPILKNLFNNSIKFTEL